MHREIGAKVNLFSFGERHETYPEFPEHGRRSWQWTIDAGTLQCGVYISLEQEVAFHDRQYSAEWMPAGHYTTLALVPKFEFGESHDYYDGPHCCIKLGWLRINYSWDWCKKCMPDDESS